MALITHKGEAICSPGLDLLTRYAAENKTKVKQVLLWGFERLPYGHIAISWKNGANGVHTTDNLSALTDYVYEQTGWPKPTLFNSALPYGAGQLYAADFEQDTDISHTEENHDTKRVVRRRQSGIESPVVRKRRVRAG